MISSKAQTQKVLKFDLLYAQDKIARRVMDLGRQISKDYAGKDLVLIGVLKGSIMFLADLMRAISIPMELEFISASSYCNGRVSAKNVQTELPTEIPLENRHLLIVEAIVDSGKTVACLIEKLNARKPASIEIVTLIDKPVARQYNLRIKYFGFTAGDDFVIGYGLDDGQKYRNLPFIGKVIA